MPPALLALAPLLAEGLGSFALPELIGSAGAFGADALGLGLSDATLGSIGGGLAGAGAGALTDKKDPLLGGVLGGVSGAIGGPGIADLGTSAVQGVGDAIGVGSDAATGTAAGVGAGLAGAGKDLTQSAALAAPAAGASAATTAAPASVGAPSVAAGGPSAAPASPGGLGDPLGDALSGGKGGAGTSLTGPGTLSSLAAPGGTGAPLGAGASAAAPAAAAVAPVSAGAGGGAAAAPASVSADTYDAINSTVAPSSDPGFLDNAMSWLGKGQHGSELASGLGLGMTALQGNQQFPGEAQLKNQARALSGQGRGFMTGQLTPGMEAGLKGAAESAKATIRSQMAAGGMSGSSSEAEALAKVDMSAEQQGADMMQKLIQQGVDETNMSSALYREIMQNAMTQDQELAKAIGGFASSFAPRPAYQPGAAA